MGEKIRLKPMKRRFIKNIKNYKVLLNRKLNDYWDLFVANKYVTKNMFLNQSLNLKLTCIISSNLEEMIIFPIKLIDSPTKNYKITDYIN